jgi:hypothetical protein
MLKMGEMEKKLLLVFSKKYQSVRDTWKDQYFFSSRALEKKEVFFVHNTIHEHLRQVRYLKTKFKLHSKEERKTWLVLC